jgi:microcystin-dependent protein
MLVGLDSGDTDFDVVEETGGAKTVTLDTTQIPSHRHQTLRERSATTGGASTQIARSADASSTVDTAVYTEYTGGGLSHANVPPYIVVYMWKRTA